MSSWSTGTNVIKEVDTNKNLTCQMFEVRKQGGGTEYLVRKSDVNLGTKSVNKNGTYTAASDSKYGFSQFSVNVRGGNGSADSHGKPTGGDIKPGGAGSAVVGTDPETGNDVVVGVDEDDNLVKTPLPSSIVLVTNPTKMDYNDGESIDLSGAVVTAKMADGSTWTSADYPSGHVPLGELVVDPAIARGNPEDAKKWTDGAGLNTVLVYTGDNVDCRIGGWGWWNYSNQAIGTHTSGQYAGHKGYLGERNASRAEMFLTAYNGVPYGVLRNTDQPNTANLAIVIPTYPIIYGAGNLNKLSWTRFGSYPPPDDLPVSTVDPTTKGSAGLYPQTVKTISLTWHRPADGKELSTTFQITVESDDTGGSGGGGTF